MEDSDRLVHLLVGIVIDRLDGIDFFSERADMFRVAEEMEEDPRESLSGGVTLFFKFVRDYSIRNCDGKGESVETYTSDDEIENGISKSRLRHRLARFVTQSHVQRQQIGFTSFFLLESDNTLRFTCR